MDKIYTLKLGERMNLDGLIIWRVPGGWIFGAASGDGGVAIEFVPYNDEFLHL